MQTLLCFSLNHASEHAVHIAYRGRQDVYSCALHELPVFFGSRKSLYKVGSRFVYFRAAADISDFSLDKHRWMDGFQSFYSLLGLAHIFCKGKSREIKDNRIESRFGGFHPFRERVRVIGVQKNGEVEFLAQASHEGR